MHDYRDIAQDAIKQALAVGADHADAVCMVDETLSYGQRLGKTETLEQAKGHKLGLRVIKNKRQAIVSSNDFSKARLSELAQRAVAMAKIVPEEAECLPADESQIMQEIPDEDVLGLWDTNETSLDDLINFAALAEDAALADSGITNSEGSHISTHRMHMALAISNGFCAAIDKSQFSASVSVIGGQGENMQTDYDYAMANHFGDLPPAAEIGKRAAQRTLAKLGARQHASIDAPVVFSPRAGRALLGSFLGAINGETICRGTSFLQDAYHQQVFSPDMNIIEDPLLQHSLAGRLFDGEGLKTQKRLWIEQGKLTGWILDLRSARKLQMEPTGNGMRGIGTAPSPGVSNVYMAAGKRDPQELIKDVKQGFYVTQMMGMGINGVTGDFSQGAEGFWIENGEKAYPVHEMTIAGNLKDMFMQLTTANDLAFEQRINVPTLRVEQMTIVG